MELLLELENGLDELEISRVEVVEEPGVVALKLCSHDISLLGSDFLQDSLSWLELIKRQIYLEAVILRHYDSQALLFLLKSVLSFGR